MFYNGLVNCKLSVPYIFIITALKSKFQLITVYPDNSFTYGLFVLSGEKMINSMIGKLFQGLQVQISDCKVEIIF